MRTNKILSISVTVAGVLLAAACGSAKSPSVQTELRPSSGPPAVVGFKYVTYFHRVADIVGKADMVVLATVAAEERSGKQRESDVVRSERRLTLRVEEVLAGQAPNTPMVTDLGWMRTAEGERPLVAEDGIRLEVGDRAVVALKQFSSGLRMPNNQSAYLLGGGQVADTPREDPLIRTVEAMTEQELTETLRSVERG